MFWKYHLQRQTGHFSDASWHIFNQTKYLINCNSIKRKCSTISFIEVIAATPNIHSYLAKATEIKFSMITLGCSLPTIFNHINYSSNAFPKQKFTSLAAGVTPKKTIPFFYWIYKWHKTQAPKGIGPSPHQPSLTPVPLRLALVVASG